MSLAAEEAVEADQAEDTEPIGDRLAWQTVNGQTFALIGAPYYLDD